MRVGNWRDKGVSSIGGKRNYEPRRLPFPAPEELNTNVSDRSSGITILNDLHADSSCHLC